MKELIIREEIKKFSTDHYSIANENGAGLLPDKTTFISHIFSNKTVMPVPALFKTSGGKEFKVVIWELDCEYDGDSFGFFGYCDFKNYGTSESGKNGFGLRLVSGEIKFRSDGTARYASIGVMTTGSYHR
jgi:hypothetical protein